MKCSARSRHRAALRNYFRRASRAGSRLPLHVFKLLQLAFEAMADYTLLA